MSTGQDLDGLTALVTGASSGIGRAIAVELAREGADVIVHGRDETRCAEVVNEITATGGTARSVTGDLTDPAQCDRLLERVQTVDVLVNNAGFAWYGPTPTLDGATFDRLFAANVRAPYLLVAAFAPVMVSNGGGSIINIGSRAGQIGRSGGAAYSATKAALAAMTRCWSAEYSPAGVRVNTVAPGPVATAALTPDRIDQLAATTIIGRAGTPQEIAALVAYLASPRAAYVTGALFAIDGGSGA